MGQKRILIIDDTPDFIEIFTLKLTHAGYEVHSASNGQEGIEKARTLKPDLVLLDMQMPGLSGAETLEMMKKDPETKDTKVLFLSSLGNPDENSKSINDKASKELGAMGYVKKSADLETLIEKVHEIIGT